MSVPIHYTYMHRPPTTHSNRYYIPRCIRFPAHLDNIIPHVPLYAGGTVAVSCSVVHSGQLHRWVRIPSRAPAHICLDCIYTYIDDTHASRSRPRRRRRRYDGPNARCNGHNNAVYVGIRCGHDGRWSIAHRRGCQCTTYNARTRPGATLGRRAHYAAAAEQPPGPHPPHDGCCVCTRRRPRLV